VAGHHRHRSVRRRLGDPLQRGGRAVGDDLGGLAAGRDPGGEGVGILLADLGVGLALPLAAGPLAQVLVIGDGQAGQPGQGAGRLGGAGQVGREDGVRLERGQVAGGPGGLLAADGVERDVGLALEPALGVERRLAVAPQD
jgi:hypothetical protein